MSLLIDLIVITAFFASLISGIKKGFVRSILKIVIVVAALIGAITYTPELSYYINDKFIEAPVISIARDSIEKLTSESVDIDTLADEQPGAFLKALSRFGVEADDIKVFIAANGYSDEEKIDRIAEYMGAPVASGISKVLAFIILFLGLWLVLWLFGLIICVIFRLPVLRTADKLLGCVFGAVGGIILAWGLSLAICELMPHLAVIYENTVSDNVIENSVIVKYLGNIDPTSLFNK